MAAKWSPKFSFEDDVQQVLKTKKGDHFASSNIAAFAANTFPDGSVIISHQLLADVIMDGNPGIVAQALYHESRHFDRLITSGWSYREVEEQKAYEDVIANMDAFDLSQKWKDVQTDGRDKNTAAINAKKLTTYAISPAEERAIKGIVDSKERGQRGLEEYFEGLKDHVSRLKAQTELENRQSDERLRLALADIVIRSCSGASVEQSELDDLPRPHSSTYYFDENGYYPNGLDSNAVLYYEFAVNYYRGNPLSAAVIAFRCAQQPPPPVPATPRTRPPALARPNIPFASMLPSIKQLSVAACQSPDAVSTRRLIPPLVISFSPIDDQYINEYLASIGSCEQTVFREVCDRIRSGQGSTIDDQWVRDRGAANRPAPSTGGVPHQGPDHEEVWRRLKPIVPRR